MRNRNGCDASTVGEADSFPWYGAAAIAGSFITLGEIGNLFRHDVCQGQAQRVGKR